MITEIFSGLWKVIKIIVKSFAIFFKWLFIELLNLKYAYLMIKESKNQKYFKENKTKYDEDIL